MAAQKKTRVRTRPRVEDTEPKKSVTKSVEHKGSTMSIVPIGENGKPMMEIVAQASELVPVAQYASVTIGPVAVRRWVEDTGDLDDVGSAISETQEVVQNVIAEDREAVEESVRLHNQREAEEEKKQSKRGGSK